MITTGWLTGTVAVAGILLGYILCVARNQRAAKKRKRIPVVWPLGPRPLANSAERQAWNWLANVFPEHAIMVKLPITRFTIPKPQERSEHWYSLLSGVYCTLSVCTADSRVIGCVDIPGAAGLSPSNQRLKQTLLSQCGVAYRVIELAKLPSPAEIRMNFLGVTNNPSLDRARDDAAILVMREKLQSSIAIQRKKRRTDADGDDASSSNFPESNFPHSNFSADSEFGQWPQQQNSFIAPLDSRTAGLQ